MDDRYSHPDSNVPILKLIAVPALITLAITLVRLVGELLNWAPSLFNKDSGGGGALVGIAWLVPIFGIWFAYKLIKLGVAPPSPWRLAGMALGALALVISTGVIVNVIKLGPEAAIPVFAVVSLAAAWIAATAWPTLGRVLLAYTLAARIPVIVVMLIAMLGNWGTHYDVSNEAWPVVDTWNVFAKWFVIGVVPQLTAWLGFTLVIGTLFAAIPAFAMRRSRPVDRTADAPAAV